MKRYGYLFEKMSTFTALARAAAKAAKGKKSKDSVASFIYNLEDEIINLEHELVTHTYRPRPYRTFMVHDPKQRVICASEFRDRVIHHAVCEVLEPIFEQSFIFDTYACRKGKGTFRALKRAHTFAGRCSYFIKLDVHKFFDSIDHDVLKVMLRRKIKDKNFLWLLDSLIDHALPWTQKGKGIPIGNLTSQNFANFYLSDLDHFIKESLCISRYLRYMDDLALFADDKRTLWDAYARIEGYLKDKLFLKIKNSVSFLADIRQGLPFLGFRIFPGIIRASRKGWRRFRRNIIKRDKSFMMGEIDDEKWTQSVSSLVGYMRQADTRNLRAAFFKRPGALEARCG